METKNTFFKKFSKSFLATLAILAGMGAAFAAWTATEVSWTDTSFNDGQAISNNMLAGSMMGYVKNAAGTKLYWKKLTASTSSLGDAARACADAGMSLPRFDQMTYYSANNLQGTDSDGVVKGINSTVNAGSYHKTWEQYSTSISCSTPGYTCGYHHTLTPNSWTNQTYEWGYTLAYYLCVYKQW